MRLPDNPNLARSVIGPLCFDPGGHDPLLVKELLSGCAPHIALREGLAGIGKVVGEMFVTELSPHRLVCLVFGDSQCLVVRLH